jgi:hypothetical protein
MTYSTEREKTKLFSHTLHCNLICKIYELYVRKMFATQRTSHLHVTCMLNTYYSILASHFIKAKQRWNINAIETQNPWNWHTVSFWPPIIDDLHKINAIIEGKYIPNQIKDKKFTYSPTLQHAQGRCSATNKYSKSVMCSTSKGQRSLQ